METIKLSRKNFWVKYYTRFIEEPENMNTCNMGWTLIWTTMLNIICAPAMLLYCVSTMKRFDGRVGDKFDKMGFKEIVQVMAIQLLMIITTMATLSGIFVNFVSVLAPTAAAFGIAFVVSPIICCVILAILFGLAGLGVFTAEQVSRKRDVRRAKHGGKKSILGEMLSSMKDKHCKKVEIID